MAGGLALALVLKTYGRTGGIPKAMKARMSEEERRHLDNLSIGIMTLTTVIVAGMFGLLGFATWANGGTSN